MRVGSGRDLEVGSSRERRRRADVRSSCVGADRVEGRVEAGSRSSRTSRRASKAGAWRDRRRARACGTAAARAVGGDVDVGGGRRSSAAGVGRRRRCRRGAAAGPRRRVDGRDRRRVGRPRPGGGRDRPGPRGATAPPAARRAGATRPVGRRGGRRRRCPRGRARRPGAAAVPAVRGPPGARAPRWAAPPARPDRRGAPGRSSTRMPCRAASDPTTCRPRARDSARPTTGGLASSVVRLGDPLGRHADALVGHREHEARWRAPRPRPRPRSRAARTTSRSRAARRARWATSDTARPDTARSSSMPTSSTRGKSAISAAAARTTSISAIGCCHWRGCSAPESTSRLSALRRMRVAMWSSLNSASSAVGSCSLRSSSSSSSSWRSSRLWLRRARFTNRSPMPLRSSARLLVRDLHGDGFDVVERLGELADLVLRVHLDTGRLHRARRRHRCGATRPEPGAGAATSRARRR